MCIKLLLSCSDFLPSCLHWGCICWNIWCGEQNVISRLKIARMCKTWLAHICGELFSQIWCIRRWFWLSWLAPSPTRAFFVVTEKFSIAFALLFPWDKSMIIVLVLTLPHMIPLQFLSQVFAVFKFLFVSFAQGFWSRFLMFISV